MDIKRTQIPLACEFEFQGCAHIFSPMSEIFILWTWIELYYSELVGSVVASGRGLLLNGTS